MNDCRIIKDDSYRDSTRKDLAEDEARDAGARTILGGQVGLPRSDLALKKGG